MCAQWCQLCKLFDPEFDGVAEDIAAEGLGFHLVKLNAMDYEEFAKKNEVSGFPTVHVYRNGARTTYTSAYTRAAFMYHLRDMLGLPPGSPATNLATKAEALRFVFWRGNPRGELHTTLVGFFPPADAADGSEAEPDPPITDADRAAARAAFAELAKQAVGRFRVAQTDSAEVIRALQAPLTLPVVRIVRDFDEPEITLPWPFDAAELLEQVERHSVPMTALVDHTNVRKYQHRKHLLIHLFVKAAAAGACVCVDASPPTGPRGHTARNHHRALASPRVGTDPESKLSRYHMRRMSRVAQRVLDANLLDRGQFTIAISDGEKYESWMEAFALTKQQLPALAIADQANDKHFAYGKVRRVCVSGCGRVCAPCLERRLARGMSVS